MTFGQQPQNNGQYNPQYNTPDYNAAQQSGYGQQYAQSGYGQNYYAQPQGAPTYQYAPQDAAGARRLVPDWDALPDALSRGTARKRAMDEAFYRYPYATGHCRAVYAEPYRREGDFVLDVLMR